MVKEGPQFPNNKRQSPDWHEMVTTNIHYRQLIGWLVGWLDGWLFWVHRPFETVFQSILPYPPKRGRKKREMIDERKNVQTTPTHTYCKRSWPLPYYNQNLYDAPVLKVYPAPSHHPNR